MNVLVIKASRLRWARHIMRMGSADIPKRFITDNAGRHRAPGCPRTQWMDGVEKDLQKIGCRNWRNVAQNKMVWWKITEEVKVL